MSLPKNTVEPDYNYTYPSERAYYEDGGTLGAQVVSDAEKSGADYGIEDPEMTKPVEAGGVEGGA